VFGWNDPFCIEIHLTEWTLRNVHSQHKLLNCEPLDDGQSFKEMGDHQNWADNRKTKHILTKHLDVWWLLYQSYRIKHRIIFNMYSMLPNKIPDFDMGNFLLEGKFCGWALA
jgi:hypothetical protein